MLDLGSFKALTFDCYGTLIDWESGIAGAFEELLEARNVEATRDEVLELHARFEPALQSGAFRPYREVLAGVVDRFGAHYSFQPTAEERSALAESIRDWPAFPDTVEALA
ncbi:MAG: haloacid dehalogenase, partial [Myxococcales bacterium]|nr:haloacid dehalogenase [Myxococcales bacterium]